MSMPRTHVIFQIKHINAYNRQVSTRLKRNGSRWIEPIGSLVDIVDEITYQLFQFVLEST